MRVCFISLGCPKNLADTEEMMGALAKAGHSVTGDLNHADAAVINTCGFLASASRESRREIATLAALKKRGKIKKLIITGCLAQREGPALIKEFPLADSILGIAAADDIAASLKTGMKRILPPPSKLCAPKYRMTATMPHSVFLKIADGCANRCAYCAIPSIRGELRSKPVADVVSEARALSANGAVEISLIAQDTTAYGTDLYGKPSLLKLLSALVNVSGPRWRIMYAYPDLVDEALVKFIASHEQIIRYMDVPVQHGCTRILKLMNRRSTEQSLRRAVSLLRRIPGMALRTTFIAGFHGETRAEHERAKKFLQWAKFDSVAVFPYSPEKGTAAYSLPDHLPAKERQRRAHELAEAQSRIVDGINKKLIGKTVNVLMDSECEGRLEGQAPDIDGYVIVESRKPLKSGETVPVKIVSAKGYIRKAVFPG